MLDVTKIILFQLIISFIIISISKKLYLVDLPSERKIHKFPVPYTGGIILAITYLFTVFQTNFDILEINNLLSFSFLIALTGFVDDKYKVNPGTKLILQTIPIFLLIDQNIFLEDLGKYYFFDTIKLASFAKIFTLLSCLLLINSFNYSDGIDGLITAISINILISYSIFLFNFEKQEEAKYILILITPLAIFFFFNIGVFKNFKVFLGDSGSNLLGFIFAFLTIYISKYENIHPMLLIWPLSYLVYEFLSVNILRLLNNKAVFKAGNDHMHYELKKLYNFKDKQILLIILLINIFFIFFGSYLYYNFIPEVSFLLYILMFLIYLSFKIFLSKKIKII